MDVACQQRKVRCSVPLPRMRFRSARGSVRTPDAGLTVLAPYRLGAIPSAVNREELVDQSMSLPTDICPADFLREAGLIDADLRRSE
jgi:hypothetical protein